MKKKYYLKIEKIILFLQMNIQLLLKIKQCHSSQLHQVKTIVKLIKQNKKNIRKQSKNDHR